MSYYVHHNPRSRNVIRTEIYGPYALIDKARAKAHQLAREDHGSAYISTDKAGKNKKYQIMHWEFKDQSYVTINRYGEKDPTHKLNYDGSIGKETVWSWYGREIAKEKQGKPLISRRK